MRIHLVVVSVFAGLILGCSVPNSNDPSPSISLINQPLSPGDKCEIFVGGPDGTQISYVGSVVEATNEMVTLESPIKCIRVTKSPPIPVVGKLFVNKGIGTEQLDGLVSVKRIEISEIRDALTP